MNLFFNKIVSSIPTIPAVKGVQQRAYSTALQGPNQDVFEKKSTQTSPTFASRRANGKTTAGDCLKELDNITCPYSGVKMISGRKMDKLEKQLYNCETIGERIDLLAPYKPCMQKLEKHMYGVFKDYAIKNPNGSLNECLQELKPDALAELRIDQLKVLDDVDKISNNINAKTALKIRAVTTNARKMIIEDRQDQIFKRKDLLSSLYNVTKDYPDQEIVSQMWTTASKLPKSTTNVNAFIVKYANRSPHEIAARLLRPSVASVEHITPASTSGGNTLANFMLAARDWNSDRGNIPLPEYIEKHPDIPTNSQKYTNDIIKAIKKDKLIDCDWYPYVLKEKLYNESEGIIDVDISKYHLDEQQALKDAPANIIRAYEDLKTENAEIKKK